MIDKEDLLDIFSVKKEKSKKQIKNDQKPSPKLLTFKYCCSRCYSTWRSVEETSQCLRCKIDGLKIGIGKFKCSCGHSWNGMIRADLKSKCYRCNSMNFAIKIMPRTKMNRDKRKRRRKYLHSCEQCYGHPPCPIYSIAQRRETGFGTNRRRRGRRTGKGNSKSKQEANQ